MPSRPENRRKPVKADKPTGPTAADAAYWTPHHEHWDPFEHGVKLAAAIKAATTRCQVPGWGEPGVNRETTATLEAVKLAAQAKEWLRPRKWMAYLRAHGIAYKQIQRIKAKAADIERTRRIKAPEADLAPPGQEPPPPPPAPAFEPIELSEEEIARREAAEEADNAAAAPDVELALWSWWRATHEVPERVEYHHAGGSSHMRITRYFADGRVDERIIQRTGLPDQLTPPPSEPKPRPERPAHLPKRPGMSSFLKDMRAEMDRRREAGEI